MDSIKPEIIYQTQNVDLCRENMFFEITDEKILLLCWDTCNRGEKAQKKRKEGHTGKLLSGSCPQAVVGSSRVQTAVGANEKSQKEIEVDDSSAASDKEDMLASNDADKTERPAKHSKNEPALSPGPIEITTYVDIISPPHTLKAKETSMTQGPFFFNTQTTQLDFLGLLAVCAVDPGFSLAVATINQSQLSWKLISPANNKKKPLSSKQGYWELLNKMNELSAKKKECTVTLSMPPLSKVAASSEKVSKCSDISILI